VLRFAFELLKVEAVVDFVPREVEEQVLRLTSLVCYFFFLKGKEALNFGRKRKRHFSKEIDFRHDIKKVKQHGYIFTVFLF
jgi:hypothetical protein